MTTAVSMVSGDNADITCSVKKPDGSVQPLVGASAIKWALATKFKSPSPLLSKTLGSGITVTDAANGILVISLQPSDTASIKGGDYVHEIEVTDATGNIVTVLQGDFTIEDDLITT